VNAVSSQLFDLDRTRQAAQGSSGGPTIGSTWLTLAGRPVDEELTRWPPDMFAFTDVILERGEAYRFTVSPPTGRQWPPASTPAWPEAVATAARGWSDRAGERQADPPDLLLEEWQVVRDALDTPIDDLASGQRWRICEALLTLHAVSDEACAHVAGGASAAGETLTAFEAETRDLLQRTGTIARIEPALMRVLPKYRTAPGGISARSISRYLTVAGPNVSYHVNRSPASRAAHGPLNMLLLPWPLRVAPADFHALPESIHERPVEPFGFFAFQPAEPLDIGLVDRLLASAASQADRVDAVVLPESSVSRQDLAALEAVLFRHGVGLLIAGLREEPCPRSPYGSNWVHFGASVDGRWSHYRQDKHHRWSLDASQIDQYHLGEVLDPRVRWWEALELRRRSLEVLERDDGQVFASLVCEDLAQLDDVLDLMRAVGPTLVVALLLDGPQLASRWTARYASMLSDDPGSAVLTLTSYGMVANARGNGDPPSSVVALWKDNTRGMREIALDADAQAILLALECQPAIRRAADGRPPTHDSVDLRLSDIIQLRAATGRDIHAPGIAA
jgi:hypothetical protein